MKAWRWLREHSILIIGLMVIAYMLVPILIIAVFSFNDPPGRYNFEWAGFTTQYWADAFGITELTKAKIESRCGVRAHTHPPGRSTR